MLDPALAGRGALVTGAASGIGQSIAVALANEGVRVRIADILPADQTLQMIASRGASASADHVDLRQESAVEQMAERAIAELGGLDIFVHSVGRFAAAPVTEISAGLWQDLFAANVTSCVHACRPIGRHMIGRQHGAILLIGSTVVCAPSYEGGAYRASKTALHSYMQTLAIELAPFGIRVNMLTPGPFPTRLVEHLPDEQSAAAAKEVPLGQREGSLDEVRATPMFLLSGQLASFITGTEVFVDGGLHLRPLFIGPAAVVQTLNT